MDNYEYCADWVVRAAGEGNVKVLDYGCGAGAIVDRLLARNIDAYGCDVFYEGGDYSVEISSDHFKSGRIRRMENGLIPFEDQTFDLIVNNQVLEHVDDLDAVLREIDRVLKPGGRVLSLFPDKGVWPEGHCGIPLLHWFPKRSKFRVYYAFALRSLGLGYFTEKKTRWKWSVDFCEWLDNWTYYRSQKTIRSSFERTVGPCTHIEDHFLEARMPERKLIQLMPAPLKRFIVRKMANLVFESAKKA